MASELLSARPPPAESNDAVTLASAMVTWDRCTMLLSAKMAPPNCAAWTCAKLRTLHGELGVGEAYHTASEPCAEARSMIV